MSKFSILKTEQHARAGVLNLPHGTVETPVFMPVGTLGSVKSLSQRELIEVGSQIILGNTYHLWLRPGMDVIKANQGLHSFISWDKPILTDSGGFQVFSLRTINKITEEGVTFRSHIDGSLRFLTPEISMEIQATLGSDIAMAFDHCPPALESKAMIEISMNRTTAWARRCLQVPSPLLVQNGKILGNQKRFGIIQGGTHLDLRRTHMQEICALPFDGFALGGFSVGEPPEKMHELLGEIGHELPQNQPRYLMGVGTPKDLLVAISQGIDMFDCVMPTRNARNGQLFTSRGKINIRQTRYTKDRNTLDPNCLCETCKNYSLSYLRHLFICKEILYAKLATLHNLTFYLNLVQSARRAIFEERFAAFYKEQIGLLYPEKSEEP